MRSLANILILYLLVLNPVSNMVLCWGEDGHFAIESASGSQLCCNEIDSSEIEQPVETIFKKDNSEDSECSHCLDILISLQSTIDAIAPPAIDPGKHVPLIGFLITESFYIQDSRSNKPFLNISHSPPIILNSIKSIQLLI